MQYVSIHIVKIYTRITAFFINLDHSFIPLAFTEYSDSLPFSGASFIPLCYIPFPSTLFHQVFHPPSLHLAIYFLVCLSALWLPNSYTILFWEFYFLPFSVHAQTIVIYEVWNFNSGNYLFTTDTK